jgi:hypothetical protein
VKKLKRIVKFTVEAERTLTFRTRGDRRVARCERCGEEVEMATVDEAARAAGVSELTICRRLEACSLHFTETADGRIFICLDSLLTETWRLRR